MADSGIGNRKSPLRRLTAGSVGIVGGSVLVGGFAGGALLAGPAGATARTFTVTTTADGPARASDCAMPVAGSCSLRDAIAAATSGEAIEFSLPAKSTITLTEGQLSTNRGLTLRGPGRSSLTIDAHGTSRVFDLGGNGSVIDISGVSLANGRVDSNVSGGAVRADIGSLRLSDVAITGSSAGNAGAMRVTSGSTVVLDDTVVTGNSSNGRIAEVSASSGIRSNRLTVAQNSSSGAGGFRMSSQVAIDVDQANVSGNTSVTGVGGLELIQGEVTLRNSTISGNSGATGGLSIVMYGGRSVIANTTISGNTGSSFAGGVRASIFGSLAIAQSTISANRVSAARSGYGASGLQIDYGNVPNPSYVVISGVIVSGNTSSVGTHDIEAHSLPGDPRLIAPSAWSSLIGTKGVRAQYLQDMGGVTFDVVDPGLNPLADNGGLTKTMSLKPTSPARNTGPTSVTTFAGNGLDQRGTGFDRISGGRADIGAFETHSVQLSFNANGGSGVMAPQALVEGEPLKLATFTRSGYVFFGWANSAAGTRTYVNGQVYAGTSRTLHAVWLPSRTVTFDANGGAGSMKSQVLGTGMRLVSNAYVLSGHSFAGWSTMRNGQVTYANGATFTGTSSVTLYAKWTRN